MQSSSSNQAASGVSFNYNKELHEAWGRFDRLYLTWARRRNVGVAEEMVLYALAIDGLNSQTEIAAHYGVPKQSVGSVVAKLVEGGYARLAPSGGDRRSKCLELTERGIGRARAVLEPSFDCERIAEEQLGPEAVGVLVDLLKRYHDALKAAIDSYPSGT